MKKYSAAQIALCGLLGAMAVALMTLGGVIPAATFCSPMLAGLLMIPVLREGGVKLALTWYAAVAILSYLLCADKEAAAVYAFLGWYPALKPRLDRLRPVLRTVCKLLIYVLSVGALYGLLLFVFRLEALVAEQAELGLATLALTLGLGGACFFLFDALLPRMTGLYCRRLRPRLWRGK